MATTPRTPKRQSSSDVNNLVSPTKKEVLSGYVLYVSPMLNRGQFSQYTVQLQTHPEFTQKMIAFNSKVHATLVASMESGSRIKMEVRRNNENGNVVFGSNCKLYPANATEVDFRINTALKNELQVKTECPEIMINALKKVEPNTNQRHTLKATVTIGEEEPHVITTQYGQSRIKRDLELADATGSINFQVFENGLPLFTDGVSYKITHIKINKFLGNIHVGLTGDSQVSEIPTLEGVQKPKSKLRTVDVDSFASIRNIKICLTCRSCKKDLIPSTERNVQKIQCTNFKCGAMCMIKKLRSRITAEVNIDLNENEDVWLTILNNEIAPHYRRYRSRTTSKSY